MRWSMAFTLVRVLQCVTLTLRTLLLRALWIIMSRYQRDTLTNKGLGGRNLGSAVSIKLSLGSQRLTWIRAHKTWEVTGISIGIPWPPSPPPPCGQKKPCLHLFADHATLLQTSDKSKQFMVEAAGLEKRQYDLEKIREILEDAICVFGELRVEWSKLVQVFQQTSNIIDVCLNKSVKKITEQVDVSTERTLAG